MAQKMMFQKKIPIRIDFEGAEAEKFEVVKNYMGLKQNTEVIRALISEKYNELKALEEKRRLQRIREAEAMEWLEKGEYKSPMQLTSKPIFFCYTAYTYIVETNIRNSFPSFIPSLKVTQLTD